MIIFVIVIISFLVLIFLCQVSIIQKHEEDINKPLNKFVKTMTELVDDALEETTKVKSEYFKMEDTLAELGTRLGLEYKDKHWIKASISEKSLISKAQKAKKTNG